MTDPTSVTEALDFLRSLGASNRLLRHGEIVAEVAADISREIARLGLKHDELLVVVGAALHDAGKIVHPEELVEPGKRHEAAGEQLLLEHGISAALARMCRTHGIWEENAIAIEDRIVTLADHTWKGARSDHLEGHLIQHAASCLNIDQWEAFILVDPVFERAASDGAARLAKLRT